MNTSSAQHDQLDPTKHEFNGKISTQWVMEICQARNVKITEPVMTQTHIQPFEFWARWRVMWPGDRVFEVTGPRATTKKQAKHLASTALLIEMGASLSFLRTHNGNDGPKQLPALEPGYVPRASPAPVLEATNNGAEQSPAASGNDNSMPNMNGLNLQINGGSPPQVQAPRTKELLRALCDEWNMEMPTYQKIKTTGPPHKPTFTVTCTVRHGEECYVEQATAEQKIMEVERLAAAKMMETIRRTVGVIPDDGETSGTSYIPPNPAPYPVDEKAMSILRTLGQSVAPNSNNNNEAAFWKNCENYCDAYVFDPKVDLKVLATIKDMKKEGWIPTDNAKELLEKLLGTEENSPRPTYTSFTNGSQIPSSTAYCEIVYKGRFHVLHGFGSSKSEAEDAVAVQMIEYVMDWLQITNK